MPPADSQTSAASLLCSLVSLFVTIRYTAFERNACYQQAEAKQIQAHTDIQIERELHTNTFWQNYLVLPKERSRTRQDMEIYANRAIREGKPDRIPKASRKLLVCTQK